MSQNELLDEMRRSVMEGDRTQAERLARDAITAAMDLNLAIEQGFIPGIQAAGDLWEKGEYFLPELITSAETMKTAMSILQPELLKKGLQQHSLGKVVIGTIQGDIHDIGKNLVAAMLSAHGFEVKDLGADVELGRFITTAQEEDADLICVSSLLTTTMLGQKTLVENLKALEIYDRFKLMVGGAPVNRKWVEEIGAHGYAADAMTAVQAAKRLVKAR